jgi:hypothetical protein
MNIVPLQPLAAQTFNATLGGQSCLIVVYQKSTGLLMDLTADNVVIFTGIICRDRDRLVRYAYLGFIGDLAFLDMQGTDDPDYTALGSRFQLAYLAPSELT